MDWRDLKEFIKDSFVYLAVFVVVLIIVLYVVSFSQVIGPSMNNTFNDGDITILSRIHYKLFSIKRGEILSFKDKNFKYLIKRVIGLPGEHVEIINNVVYINDEILEEKYKTDNSIKVINNDYGVIPENQYFVLGDNRDDSYDSRSFGFINKEDIIGKIVFTIFPFNKIKLIK